MRRRWTTYPVRRKNPSAPAGTKTCKSSSALEREISQLELQSAGVGAADDRRVLGLGAVYELMTKKEQCDESLAAKMDEWKAVAAELEGAAAMSERKIRLALAAVFAAGGVVQLLPLRPRGSGRVFLRCRRPRRMADAAPRERHRVGPRTVRCGTCCSACS